jgi:hypothetical protein
MTETAEEIRALVREKYGAIARKEVSGCGCSSTCDGGADGVALAGILTAGEIAAARDAELHVKSATVIGVKPVSSDVISPPGTPEWRLPIGGSASVPRPSQPLFWIRLYSASQRPCYAELVLNSSDALSPLDERSQSFVLIL